MIWHIVERDRVDCGSWIVATAESSDDPQNLYSQDSRHRGSLMNVLSRYLEVLELYPYDYVVRIRRLSSYPSSVHRSPD